MGSMAMTTPSVSGAARAGPAEVGHLRLLVHRAADAVADQALHHREAGRLDLGLHGVADVADPVAHPRRGDAARE